MRKRPACVLVTVLAVVMMMMLTMMMMTTTVEGAASSRSRHTTTIARSRASHRHARWGMRSYTRTHSSRRRRRRRRRFDPSLSLDGVGGDMGGGGGGGGGDGGVGLSSCVAKAPKPSGVDRADAPGNVSVITVTNVGGDGQYWEVHNMTMGKWPRCTVPKAELCLKKAVKSKGPLSPFDEELAINFAGPMHIFNVAVYAPSGSGDGSWGRVGYYDTCTSENVAWMKDSAGGGTNAGDWNMCWGGSQTYASADGKGGASTPTHFNGYLPAGNEVHLTSQQVCSSSSSGGECGGFVYGLGMRGFKGDEEWGQKMFVMHVQMPHQPLSNNDPLITINPVKIFNTKQYGCNCRGMGPFGGCGELNFHETLAYQPGKTSKQGYFTMYSFQGVTGSGQPYFIRPDKDSAIYVAIFKKVSASKGQVQLMRLPRGSFSFPKNVTASFINSWFSKPGIVRRMPDRLSLPLPPP